MSERLTPVKAIRALCIQCMGGGPEVKDARGKVVIAAYRPIKEIQKCPCKESCPLYPYRLGTHPGRRGIGAETTTVVGLS